MTRWSGTSTGTFSYQPDANGDESQSGDPVNNIGLLYQQGVAGAACPTGWHLPSLKEWLIVLNHIDPFVDIYKDCLDTEVNEGKSLSGKLGEGDTSLIDWQTDTGRRNGENTFFGASGSYGGYVWTSTANCAIGYGDGNNIKVINFNTWGDKHGSRNGLAVRCFKD